MSIECPYKEGDKIRFNMGSKSAPKYVFGTVKVVEPAYHKPEGIEILRLRLPGESHGLIKDLVTYSDDARISKMPAKPGRLEMMLAGFTRKMPKIFRAADEEEEVEDGEGLLSPAYD